MSCCRALGTFTVPFGPEARQEGGIWDQRAFVDVTSGHGYNSTGTDKAEQEGVRIATRRKSRITYDKQPIHISAQRDLLRLLGGYDCRASRSAVLLGHGQTYVDAVGQGTLLEAMVLRWGT
ncbi:hypothetical protein HDU97_009265, partial [Phlyctochytrium planicorne]